jgi:hypothetical protein
MFGSETYHFFTKQVGKNGNLHRLGASGSFRALSFHVGLKSGVTNSKKIKKMWDLHVKSFYVTYMWEKNSNLEKKCLPESSSIQMTYHVRGCMTFRLNELEIRPWAWHSLSEQCHIGHARGPWDGEERHGGRFLIYTTKSAFSIFGVPKLGFFVKQLIRLQRIHNFWCSMLVFTPFA